MKKINLFVFTFAFLALFTCKSSLEASTTTKGFEYKKDRDYLAIISRTQHLHVIDAKMRQIVKSCKLEGSYGPGGLVITEDGTKAFVLQDRWQAVYGYDLKTCKNFFKTSFTDGNKRGISTMSFAVSKDAKEVYAIYNPSIKHLDHYEVKSPVFAVYKTSDGLNAKAVKEFEAPRQTTLMAVGHDKQVYVNGPDIYKINPESGEVKTYVKQRNWTRKNYSPPDLLAMWPIGNVSKEFLLMNTSAKFNDEEQSMEKAEFVWGYTRIDLENGEIDQRDFAPIETIMFTGMTHPKDTNLLYGVLTDLTKFDIKNKKVIKRVLLDHTYYCINFATDGSELYVGGTLNDIAVYDPETLDKIGSIILPKGDTGAGTLQLFRVK